MDYLTVDEALAALGQAQKAWNDAKDEQQKEERLAEVVRRAAVARDVVRGRKVPKAEALAPEAAELELERLRGELAAAQANLVRLDKDIADLRVAIADERALRETERAAARAKIVELEQQQAATATEVARLRDQLREALARQPGGRRIAPPVEGGPVAVDVPVVPVPAPAVPAAPVVGTRFATIKNISAAEKKSVLQVRGARTGAGLLGPRQVFQPRDQFVDAATGVAGVVLAQTALVGESRYTVQLEGEAEPRQNVPESSMLTLAEAQMLLDTVRELLLSDEQRAGIFAGWLAALGPAKTREDMLAVLDGWVTGVLRLFALPRSEQERWDTNDVLGRLAEEVEWFAARTEEIAGLPPGDGRRTAVEDTAAFLLTKLATGREFGKSGDGRWVSEGILAAAEDRSMFAGPPGPGGAGADQSVVWQLQFRGRLPMTADVAAAFVRLFTRLGVPAGVERRLLATWFAGVVTDKGAPFVTDDGVVQAEGTIAFPPTKLWGTLSGTTKTIAADVAKELYLIYKNMQDSVQHVRATQLLFFTPLEAGEGQQQNAAAGRRTNVFRAIGQRPKYSLGGRTFSFLQSYGQPGAATAVPAARARPVVDAVQTGEAVAVVKAVAKAVAEGRDNDVVEGLVAASRAGMAAALPVFAAARPLLLADDWHEAAAAAASPDIHRLVLATAGLTHCGGDDKKGPGDGSGGEEEEEDAMAAAATSGLSLNPFSKPLTKVLRERGQTADVSGAFANWVLQQAETSGKNLDTDSVTVLLPGNVPVAYSPGEPGIPAAALVLRNKYTVKNLLTAAGEYSPYFDAGVVFITSRKEAGFFTRAKNYDIKFNDRTIPITANVKVVREQRTYGVFELQGGTTAAPSRTAAGEVATVTAATALPVPVPVAPIPAAAPVAAVIPAAQPAGLDAACSTARGELAEATCDDEAWQAIEKVHDWLSAPTNAIAGIPSASWRGAMDQLRDVLSLQQFDTPDSQAWRHFQALEARRPEE